MFIFQYVTEFIFAVGMFINALLFIPQAFNILKQKDSKELSLLTFAGFNVMQLASSLHGFWRQDYALALGALASFITCGGVTILIIFFRRKNHKA